MKQNKEIVAEALLKINPRLHIESKDMIGNGELDSLRIVMLVTELGAAFDIVIPVREIVPENFRSVETLTAMIERLSDI